MDKIYILTAWIRRPDESTNSRSWFWASSKEECLSVLEKQPDFYMESGTYSHVVIESFRSGGWSLADSADWYYVPFDYATHTYGKPQPCDSPDPHIVNFGLG